MKLEMNLPYTAEYTKAARQVTAEGIVMLKNDQETLPLESGTKIAMFGRIQYDYVKSGTGSGGLVNVAYVQGIHDAFEEDARFTLDSELDKIYKDWLVDHPFDNGHGWATEPWFQIEMPLDDELVSKMAEKNDVAICVIGRLSGEEKDHRMTPGSYLLTNGESEMLRLTTKYFKKVVVLLNVGAVLDMSFVETYNPSSVLYVWQGGQEGGNGVLDVLSGDVNPCGKLTDTVVKRIVDIPSTMSYGGVRRNYYEEDIYVGYRYFESATPENVQYPFGFGLSYTTFNVSCSEVKGCEKGITVKGTVENTGKYAGKEVVEIYVSQPKGKLGKPERVLSGYTKTGVIPASEKEEYEVFIPWMQIASYDDSGITGNKSSYVLEEGEYKFFVGTDVRTASFAGAVEKAFTVLEKLEERMAPTQEYKVFKNTENGMVRETVSLGTVDVEERRLSECPIEIKQTGDMGYKLTDVKQGKVTMDDFIAQLSDHDLITIVRGEGPCSTKVTLGCVGSFGGVTETLEKFGIPIANCADGPSGIRRDNGAVSFLLPGGVMIACTWNEKLIEELYYYEGKELHDKKIESLLGPGLNIHRNPLNGRNFEYFSEDPLIAGKTAAAELRGMHKGGGTGTIKHCCCNNQEADRRTVEAVVSERALREIYLKPFEIAVKEGQGDLIMTSYNPVNNYWTASNYDLVTGIIRNEWGFKGVVMSDWWADGNFAGEEGKRSNVASMIMAQNDVYMIFENSEENLETWGGPDNSEEELKAGRVTRAEYQRCAKNICNYLMTTQCMRRMEGIVEESVEDMYVKPVDDSYWQVVV